MAAFPPNMLTGKEYYEDRAELNERAAGMFKKAKAMTPTAQEIATSAAWRLLSHLDQAATPSVTDVEIVARFVTKLRSLPTAPAQTGAATPAPTAGTIAASRGTRTLTPRMKAAVALARNHTGEGIDALLIADLLKAIDHLNTESSV